jgi:hypothetical protein
MVRRKLDLGEGDFSLDFDSDFGGVGHAAVA